jgi:UDP-N-acetylglucosamine 2-epimerase
VIRLLFIAGTRPEAIKLCPTIRYCRAHPAFDAKLCVTAQHRHLLDQVLTAFDVRPDHDLDLMLPNQTLFQSTSRILSALAPVLEAERPDMVIVQGDTTTTFCGALAAFYTRAPVGHVEAGLRTGDLYEPFPEELNRVLTSRIARLHFAPTQRAAENLIREGAPRESVSVTGNTGIDAVLHICGELEAGRLRGAERPEIDPERKLILVTAHRRESFGAGFERICRALHRLARRDDIQIVYPVHPNPNVQAPVRQLLSNLDNVLLIEPVEYVAFVDLMRRAHILLTDSGGIQEEGPSLGKPILVLRDKTERPEAVEAGVVKLVGSDEDRIVGETERLLDDPEQYAAMARVHNPYGDGRASGRIANLIASFFSR